MDNHLAGHRPANYNTGSSDSELADEQPVLESNTVGSRISNS